MNTVVESADKQSIALDNADAISDNLAISSSLKERRELIVLKFSELSFHSRNKSFM